DALARPARGDQLVGAEPPPRRPRRRAREVREEPPRQGARDRDRRGRVRAHPPPAAVDGDHWKVTPIVVVRTVPSVPITRTKPLCAPGGCGQTFAATCTVIVGNCDVASMSVQPPAFTIVGGGAVRSQHCPDVSMRYSAGSVPDATPTAIVFCGDSPLV